jgi:hypothetical protein
MRTVSVVVQICELVVPLCYYAQRIFEKGDDDQEAADCRKISISDLNQLRVPGGSSAPPSVAPGIVRIVVEERLTA